MFRKRQPTQRHWMVTSWVPCQNDDLQNTVHHVDPVLRLDPQKKIILPWKKIFPDHPGKKIILPSKKNYSTVKTWKGLPFRALEKKLITGDAYMRPVRTMLLEHTCLVGAHGGASDVLGQASWQKEAEELEST